jgi:hypothetical protein
VLAGEGAGDGLRDQLGVELEPVDLAVAQAERAGDGLGGLVLVDVLRGAARVGQVEGGDDLDRRDLHGVERAAGALGPLAGEARPLDRLARYRGAAVVVDEDALVHEQAGDELQGVVRGAPQARLAALREDSRHRRARA